MKDDLPEIDEMANHAKGSSLVDDIVTIASDFDLDPSVIERARSFLDDRKLADTHHKPSLMSVLSGSTAPKRNLPMCYLAAFVVAHVSRNAMPAPHQMTEMCLILILPPGTGDTFRSLTNPDARLDALSQARAGWVGTSEEAQPAVTGWRSTRKLPASSEHDNTARQPINPVDIVVLTSKESLHNLNKSSRPSERTRALERLLQFAETEPTSLEVFSNVPSNDQELTQLDPWRW
jgi:hypothetical protein